MLHKLKLFIVEKENGDQMLADFYKIKDICNHINKIPIDKI